MNRIFIDSDFEGIAGIVNWRETKALEDYGMFRTQQSLELNAIIRALKEIDPECEILIRDFHGNMRNILFSEFHAPGVRIIRGSLSWGVGVEFIGQSISHVILHGFHAKANTAGAILPHSFTSKIRLFLNDCEIGEIGLIMMMAAINHVPTIMITGDRAACHEARELNPEISMVITKEAFSPFAAICETSDQVIKNIHEKVLEAFLPAKSHVLPSVLPPYRLKVNFTSRTQLQFSSLIPGTRIEGDELHFTSADLLEVYNLILVIYVLMSSEKNL